VEAASGTSRHESTSVGKRAESPACSYCVIMPRCQQRPLTNGKPGSVSGPSCHQGAWGGAKTPDYLTRMKMAFLDEGATSTHRWYGWVVG
jgi:hypothetical protein